MFIFLNVRELFPKIWYNNIIHFLAKAVPFRLEFYSDGYEWAPTEGIAAGKGAKIYYFQTTC